MGGQARKAEDLGYDTLFMPDHFGDQLAPVPALMAAADATTGPAVGTLVFDNDYKHPVVLAKELATLDVLSGGRMELGLGAGWMSSTTTSPASRDSPGRACRPHGGGHRRPQGLASARAVLLQGDHYMIDGYDGSPKPAQSPPPFLIGGGAKRVLRSPAVRRDIVGINPSIHSGQVDAAAAQNGAAGETDQKLQWVRDAAGDGYADLEINLLARSPPSSPTTGRT